MKKFLQQKKWPLAILGACGLGFAIGFVAGKTTVPSSHQTFLFSFDGEAVTAEKLNQEEKQAFEALTAKEEQAQFSLAYDRYRERDRLLKSFIISRFIKTEAAKQKKSEAEVAQEVLNITPSTREQARSLYSASDPSAPLKDFPNIEPQLKAYIDEVARHEAFDKLIQTLETQKRLSLNLKRPVRENVKIDTTDFPKIGLTSAKHKVVTFVDYFCKDCVTYNLEMSRLIRDRLSDTEFILIPFPYTRPDKSLAISRGALCAAVQNKFIDFHMAATARGDTLDRVTPTDLAQSGGMDVSAFNRCYYSGTGLADLLTRAQSEANRAGVLSTPVTFVNGKLFEGREQFAAIRKQLE